MLLLVGSRLRPCFINDEIASIDVILACLQTKGAPDLRRSPRILQQLLLAYAVVPGSQLVLHTLVRLWIEEQRRNFSYRVSADLL